MTPTPTESMIGLESKPFRVAVTDHGLVPIDRMPTSAELRIQAAGDAAEAACTKCGGKGYFPTPGGTGSTSCGCYYEGEERERTRIDHETVAAKLAAVGHRSPSVQMTSEESHARARAQAKLTGTAEVEKFNQSLAGYLSVREVRPTWKDKATVIIANLWPRISHAAIGMGIVLVTAIALIVGCVVTAPKAKAVEVPDAIIRGLVMVETGAKWKNIGDISGGWSTGAAGEISHFQLTDDALREMKVADKAERIRRCPVLAESYARAFLVICYEKRGNWRDALATYNAWSRYRSAGARDYADRVLALASVL